jgi:hypothetical protein
MKDTTPHDFMTYAESYGRAAFVVSEAVVRARLPWTVQVATLALHCVELSLQAVLLKEGMAPNEVGNRFGHDIKALFQATPVDRSELDVHGIEFYSDAVLSQALRYRRKDKPFYDINDELLLEFMEKVFHRCLEHVAPGANRRVRP